MKPFGFRLTLLAVFVVVAASSVSCNRDEAQAVKTAKNTKPAPEESYAVIMETFHRRMSDVPLGFVISDSSGRTTMTGKTTVEDELIRPKNENEPYKAIITVSTESHYSLRRSKEDSEGTDREKNADSNAANSPSDGHGTGGVESYDSALVRGSSGQLQNKFAVRIK